MRDYIYDGSFEGLLTVIYHHYYTDHAAGICTGKCYQPSFLQESMTVVTEPDKADKVYRAIREKISEYDLRGVYRAWLSCDPQKEIKILRYVVLGFQQGHRTSSLHGDPVVNAFQSILKKISNEKERMLQFVRFSVVKTEPGLLPAIAGEDAAGEILYAAVEPDNDVIGLAAGHFCERFRNDPFIIHDVGRGKAIFGLGGRWVLAGFTKEDAPSVAGDERYIRQLWKRYFDHIAILERTNTRCQNNFIPDRYRKHLTEIITADRGIEV